MRKFVVEKDNPKLHELQKWMQGHKGFIVGGVFKDIFAEKPVKDVDICFEKEEHYLEALNYFYSNPGYSLTYICKTSTAFTHKTTGTRLDLIKSRFGKPLQIIEAHDFTITCYAYYYIEAAKLYQVARIDSFFDAFNYKNLVIDLDLRDPVSTFERAFRYKGYGYSLDRESKKKLIEQLQGLNTDTLSYDDTESL